MMMSRILAHYQSIAALGIRGASVLAGFALTFVIGRTMGPLANGQYALVTQTAMFLSVVAVGGLDMAVVRHFSAASAHNQPIARSALLASVAWSLGFAGILIAALVLGGGPLMRLLMKHDMPPGTIGFLSMILVSRAMTRMLSAVLRSQRAYMVGQAVEVLFIPVAVIMLMVVARASTVHAILALTSGVGLAVAAAALWACLRYTATSAAALRVPVRVLMTTAAPLWGVAISLNIAEWYCLATAAAVLSVYDAGLYRVALQIGSALAIVNMGLFSVFSPQIGSAHALGNRRKIGQLTRTATRLSVLCVVPVSLVLFAAAGWVLSLVGNEFAAAATVLRVTIIGQAIYTVTGPAGLTLAMTGHARVNFLITGLSTLALLVIVPVAAHFGGLMGISVGATMVLIARNVASLIAVRRLLGINVVTGSVRTSTAEAMA